MISGRCNSLSGFPFTASQWQELEQQLLTYKYIMSGLPVPPQLISIPCSTSSSSSSALFPHQQSLPYAVGWGCFQLGYGKKIDPEPGRCRRTDGKKWRCSKEACPDSKYCERHMHRGKNKSKKNPQVLSVTPTKSTTNNNMNNSIFSSTSPSISCSVSPSHHHDAKNANYSQLAYNTTSSFYPFLSSQPSTSLSNCTYQSTQDSTAPHWLLEPQSYDQPKKEIRYLDEMKGAGNNEMLSLGPFQDIAGFKNNKQGKDQRYGVDNKEDETQKLFHYFLGDWSRK